MGTRNDFCYIVVTVNNQRCFINKDMDYSDDFDEVMEFYSKEDARVFISKHGLENKSPQIINMLPKTKN